VHQTKSRKSEESTEDEVRPSGVQVDALLDSDRKMRDAVHRGGSESIHLGECVVSAPGPVL